MSAYLNLTGSIVVPLRAAADDAPLFNLTDPRPSGEVDLTASVVVLVVIAGLPLQLWLIHCLWLSRRPSQACGWDMSERRSRDEAQLLERLSTARRVEQQVRARVTFGSLAVAWACEIVAWGPLTVSWATGVSEADFYARSGIPLPVYGIPAALGPALVLLACRPLDHIGVRLAGAFCGASYLYYFVIDILDCLEDDWPAAAASGWAPLETVLLALQLFGIFAASLGSASGFFAASLSRATRDALRRHWIVLRTSYALGAASWGTQYVVLLALGRPVSPYLALSAYCDCIGTLIFTLFFTERTRGCIHRALGWSGLSESFRSLAAVASLIGCGGATSVMERRCRDAIGSFRGLPWSKLTAGDLAAEGAEEGCDGRRSEDETVPAAMGEVDAFISHSWSDDGREKHEALQGWAEAFEASNGRSPIVWLDRCCIRQDEDIAASLLGLPVYLSGCRSLLVLYGASYCGRLWCVMEVFCFLAMGGKLDAIQVLLLPSSSAARAGSSYASVGEPGKGKGAAWTLRRGLAKFRLSEATCTVPGDRTRMLAVIECAFGDDVPFNRIVRSLLSGLSHRHASCTSRGTTFRSISRGGHGGSLVSVAEPSGPSGRASADAEGVACKV